MQLTTFTDARRSGAMPCASHFISPPMPTLSHDAFLDWIAAEKSGVFAVSEAEFWRLEVIVDDEIRLLADTTSTAPRTFATLSDVSDFLLVVGISEFSVIPNPSALRAADYDNWVLQAIQEAVREADAPDTEWIANEEVEEATRNLTEGNHE
ncbi:hypothetical protein PAQ31011_04706 [Pandoraea aquatica]|uniref:Uncharacterized protein n=1 Tax=Pandoraea aquatica TaxID=2508290 RepID=A0A5E4YSP9_9BURK|nr:hypothetical protein [Pandoraea aquatica]VVE50933.1 hypothetical protein PAQ31011_04706 [Pandoraea aquatica]